MSWLAEVAIGALAVVALVGTLIWLAKKGYFEPDVNEGSQAEREELSESVGAEDFRIPYRRKVTSWSLPYKVFVGSFGLLLVGGGFAGYQMLKTGSPAEQWITGNVRLAMIGVIGVFGGVRLKAWFDEQIGWLVVVYERTGRENLTARIPYAKSGVRRHNGVVTIPEVAEDRLLGLFWRYRQVGEDRRLRAEDKPLDDVISHQIPDHGDELPDGAGYLVPTREDGDQILAGATSTADLTYGSPNSLSDERATQLREQKRRKEAELQAVQATNAELYKQITKMRKKIENEEYQDRTDLIEDFGQFADMYSTLKVDITENGDGGGSAVDKNGESAEASP